MNCCRFLTSMAKRPRVNMSASSDNSKSSIAERLAGLESRIQAACDRAGRDRASVTLIGISKFHSADAIREAYEGGLRDFGENYVQEMLEKMHQLSNISAEIRWHFTGRVQRNKAKQMAGCHWIHSVSSAAALRVLGEKAPMAKLLLQISEEEQKKGFTLDGLRQEFEDLLAFGYDQIQGFMSLPPSEQSPLERRQHFAALRQLRDGLESEFSIKLPCLSMGMSADFEVAIEEGATFIRIGTAIFGPRPAI